MSLEKLSDGLKNVVKKIMESVLIDDRLINEVVRDLQKVLISADVNVKLVLELSNRIKERARKEKSKLDKKQRIVKILYEELVKILGKKKELKLRKMKIMLLGLQGSGKTTTAAKLARYFQKKGLSSSVLCLDTYRPAAYEQLLQLLKPYNIRVYGDADEKNPIKIAEKFINKIKSDVVIIDTAGRHKNQESLFNEMKELDRIIKPDEKFLVIDATIGQAAKDQASAFHREVGITGIIVTKLDGSAKGGGALTAVAETGAPILFIGTGEKIEEFEEFDPDKFISRLIGLGDISTLLEKAKEVIKEEEIERMMKHEITLLDLENQIENIMKMGKLKDLIKMIPGFSLFMSKEFADLTEQKMKSYLVILKSMTKEEKLNPKIINSSRIRRIAFGSGKSIEEVRELLKYYNQMKKAMKLMKRGRIPLPFGFRF